MRTKLNVSFWLLLVPLAGAAEGQTARPPDARSGHELLQACNAADYGSDFWFCQGYLTGLHQTTIALIRLGAIKPPYCPPVGFTNRTLRNVVVSYLRAYPGELNQSAEVLTLAALSTAYPCPKQ
jgi:hypothetical protein